MSKLADDRERPPGEEWRNRPGVARQGARFGTIGCIGCATFVVLALILGLVLFNLGEKGASDALTHAIPPPSVSPAPLTTPGTPPTGEVERALKRQEAREAHAFDEQRRANAAKAKQEAKAQAVRQPREVLESEGKSP